MFHYEVNVFCYHFSFTQNDDNVILYLSSVCLSLVSFFLSPSGKKFRSKPQLSRYLGNTVDLGCFDFRTGKMLPGKLQKNKQRLRHDPLSLAKVAVMDRTLMGQGLWMEWMLCVLDYRINRIHHARCSQFSRLVDCSVAVWSDGDHINKFRGVVRHLIMSEHLRECIVFVPPNILTSSSNHHHISNICEHN